MHMDQDGQLTFNDDPLLTGSNEAFRSIEEGDFSAAVEKLDELMSVNPDYPGLAEGYRAAKFWQNRQNTIDELQDGKETADFLMKQWEKFSGYAQEKNLTGSTAYNATMRYIFFTASEHYKIAFNDRENPTDNFTLLMQLGTCFLRLGEYAHTIEALEYARSSYRSNAPLLALLGEAYFHKGDIPKSLLYFREAFLIDPSEVDLSLVNARPIMDIIAIIEQERPDLEDVREWVPVYGTIHDIFYVKRHLNSQQVEQLKREIYTLEQNYQTMSKDRIQASNIVPRLVNKYLWMLDYFEFQNYDFESITEIRTRLLAIDRELFEPYFKNKPGLS